MPPARIRPSTRSRSLVSSLAQEFDLLDIAAAAVAMIHAENEQEAASQSTSDRALDESPAYDRSAGDRRPGDRAGRPTNDRHVRSDDRGGDDDGRASGMTVLFVGAGKNAGIRPGDLVGAITNEAKLTARQVGGIKIDLKYSLVEVPEELADRVIKALKATSLRGQKVNVRRSKD